MPRAYTTYSASERLTILATAIAERLSANEIHRRFGVKQVTYYSWRKKHRLRSPQGRGPRSAKVNVANNCCAQSYCGSG